VLKIVVGGVYIFLHIDQALELVYDFQADLEVALEVLFQLFVVLVPFFTVVRIHFVELSFVHGVVLEVDLIAPPGNDIFLLLFHKFLELLVELVFYGTEVFADGLYLFISHQALAFPLPVCRGPAVIVQKGNLVPFFIVGILGVLGIGLVDFIHGIIGIGGFGIAFGRCVPTRDRFPGLGFLPWRLFFHFFQGLFGIARIGLALFLSA